MAKSLFGISDEKLFYDKTVFKLDVQTKEEKGVIYHNYFYNISAASLANAVIFIWEHMAGVIGITVIKDY